MESVTAFLDCSLTMSFTIKHAHTLWSSLETHHNKASPHMEGHVHKDACYGPVGNSQAPGTKGEPIDRELLNALWTVRVT